MIMAPMDATKSGTYEITLHDKMTGRLLRDVKVLLNSDEQTEPMRENTVDIHWDPSDAFADIFVHDTFLVRIGLPPNLPE